MFAFIKSSFCPTHIPDACFKMYEFIKRKKVKYICTLKVKIAKSFCIM